MTTSTTPAETPQQKSRFGSLIRQLWFQVVVGAVLGIAVGILLPDVGKAVSPLNDWFISLVKMIVVPVVFCVVTLGIASMDSLRKAGRIGVKALSYFLVLSLGSMVIGLVVGERLQTGRGMNIDVASLDTSKIPGVDSDENFDRLRGVRHQGHSRFAVRRDHRVDDSLGNSSGIAADRDAH